MKGRPFNYPRLSFVTSLLTESERLNAPQSWPLKWSELERENPWRLFT